MSDALPKGWTSIELEEHVYIAGRIGWRGLKRSEYTQIGPRFLAVKNILPNGQIDFTETDHLSRERYDESPEIQLKRNDILLTKDGTIGKVGMVDSLPGLTTVNSSILVVRPNNELLLDRYLFHYLRGPKFQEIARKRITGSAIPHLFQKDIKKLRALVPPINEQRRIVAKLETLLGKMDACQQRLSKVPVLLKRFRQSVLAAAFSGRLTADWREANKPAAVPGQSDQGAYWPLPDTWEWRTLESVCDNVVDCPHSTPKWTSSGRLCVRTTNFRPGSLDLSEVRYVSDETFKQRIERLRPHPGDILYSREGGILGIACTIPSDIELCLGQRMMLLRPRPEFRGDFLMHWLNSPAILRKVQELSGGTASPHLNVGDIKKFSVPVPPPFERQEIVRRVKALSDLADQIEGRFAKAQAVLDKLTPSLLATAFRGELVPTEAEVARNEGRDYEPASKLLERVQQQRVSDDDTEAARPTRSKASTGTRRIQRTARSAQRNASG